MFAILKFKPKLLGAKVKIKFLYYNQYDDDNETLSYEQAVIDKISIKPEIKALDFTLFHCVVGIKRVWGIHHFDHVLRIEHLRVIKEGPSDVKWEPTPAPRHSRNALQAFDLKLFYHHHQHDYGLASQPLFTSLQKPLVQKNWTFFRSFIGDMTNSPLKKANLSNIKDINPFQWSNYPLEQNTPSLAATFHQWLMVWSIMRTEVLSSMVSKTRIDRWLNAEQVPARASCH